MTSSATRALFRTAFLLLSTPLSVSADTLGNFTYSDNGSSITITDYFGWMTPPNVVIPPTIAGKPVTVIGERAFMGVFDMQTISIPATVSVIQSQAFFSCSGLTGVSLPTGLLTLEAEAFYNCRRLESIILPGSLTSIGEGAFGLTGITSVVIPGRVTFLGDKSFEYCRKLERVRFEGPLEEIGENTFLACDKLERIHLPQGLLRIGQSAFAGCAFSSINLDGVRELERYAFSSCRKLSDVVFPKSIRDVGDGAFSNCVELATGIFEGDAPKFGNKVFLAAHDDFKLIVSDKSEGFTTPRWNGYKVSLPEAEIAVLNDKGIQLTAAEGTSYKFPLARVGRMSETVAVYTIRNVGNRQLNDLAAGISGGNWGEFSLKSLPKKSLAPGESVKIRITFTPRDIGRRVSSLLILSSDDDEASIRIPLSGVGVAKLN